MKKAHDNSMEAYRTLDRRKRREAILQVFRTASDAMSDREVCLTLGYSDMNAVRPRITELRDEGMIIETGKQYEGHRPVRVCEMIPLFREMV